MRYKANSSPNNILALGVDIGGTSTKIGLVDPDGELYEFRQIPTRTFDGTPKSYLETLVKECREVLQLAEKEVIGIGMSILGPQNEERTGPIASANAPWLVGTNFRLMMESSFGLPVVINNDLTAHALAELHFGKGHEVDRLLCVALGTGIGAAMIINGQPLRLWGGTTGDCGRCVIDPDSKSIDRTGVRGSLEALCSVPSIEEMALQRYGHEIPAFDVIKAARIGNDKVAIQIIENIGFYLGQGLAILYPIFFPQRVVLSGGISEAGLVLLEACKLRFHEIIGPFIHKLIESDPKTQHQVEIVLSDLSGESGILGATVEIFQLSFN